ncbi:MAG: manganese-dependent inorganic pyrophosphatase [Gammaproteobacteria bacterium]
MIATVYVVGHRNPDADSICTAIAYAALKQRLGHSEIQPARAGELDDETTFVLEHFGVPVPKLLEDAAGLELILVDHNETAQALPHIEQAHILEVWEHHRIGDLRTAEPIVFHSEPLGATATLICEQYRLHGIEPSRVMAGMLLAAIWSDTVNLRSPTTSEKDRRMAAWLQPLAGVDASFVETMLRVKSSAVIARNPAKLVREDYKEFEFDVGRVGISQVEVMDADALALRKQEILSEMRALRDTAGLTQEILMITDMQARASELWVVGDRIDLFERALGPSSDGCTRLPGVMSRKQQVVPLLEQAFTTGNAPASGEEESV